MIVHTGQEEALGVGLLIGIFAGGSGVGMWLRSQLTNLKTEIGALERTRQQLELEAKNIVRERDELFERWRVASNSLMNTSSELAQLNGRRDAEREGLERERQMIGQLRQELAGHFSQLSTEALNKNSDMFLKLARESIGGMNETAKGDLNNRQQAINESLKPVAEQMKQLEKHVNSLEEKRSGAYGQLMQQLNTLLLEQNKLQEASMSLREETARLASSLRSSSVRGRWGELQLRNVIEMAGMSEYCDFVEQRTFTDSEGTQQRPDVTVRLPSGHSIIVDAKAPLTAYLDAADATNEEDRATHMRKHAAAIRTHCIALKRKAYWEQFDVAPEFVVLFLPGEVFYSAALQADQELLNWSWEQNVILATPTMLIALLRTIATGWRAAAIEQNALEVRKIGIDLHRSLSKLSTHIHKMAKHIGGSVDAYNEFVGSFERNVYSKARKFSELKVVSEEIPDLLLIDKTTRGLSRDELSGNRVITSDEILALPFAEEV